MKAHYAQPDELSSDRSPKLIIPATRSIYSMQDIPQHVPYNMHPSTTLTPTDWRYCTIHPDTGNRFKLTGHGSASVWIPADLAALKVHVKGGKVWGLTKARALEIGLEIENAMRAQHSKPPLAAPGQPTPAQKPQEGAVAAQEPPAEPSPAKPVEPTVLNVRRIPKAKPKSQQGSLF